MELSEVVSTFEHNLQQLEQAQVEKYLSFEEFKERINSRHLYDMGSMLIVREAACTFQSRIEGIIGNQKYEECVEFSKRLTDGISKSADASSLWECEEPPGKVKHILLSISERARNKDIRRKKQQIKDILSFECYAAAHLTLRDYVPEFFYVYSSPLTRVGWNRYTEIIQMAPIHFGRPLDNIDQEWINSMLPVPDHEDIFNVCKNFLSRLAHETGTKFEQKRYMQREGALYAI